MGNIAVNQEKENTSQEQPKYITFNPGQATGKFGIEDVLKDLNITEGQSATIDATKLSSALKDSNYTLEQRAQILALIYAQLATDFNIVRNKIWTINNGKPAAREAASTIIDSLVQVLKLSLSSYSKIIDNLPADLENNHFKTEIKSLIEQSEQIIREYLLSTSYKRE